MGCVKLPSEDALEVQERKPAMKKNTNQTKWADTAKRMEAKETFTSYLGIDLGDKHCEV